MPSIRVGYGSDFVVKNQRVGIGTDDPQATLEVRGNIRGDFNITGVSTLRSYAGFIPQKQNIATKSTTIGVSTIGVGTFVESYETETGYESLVGEFNTLSDDLIVDDGKIFEIKTTSITGVTAIGTQSYDYDTSRVSLGTLESISIQSHFTLPNGGIETRPENPIEGTVRFNDDLNTLEFYNGIEWRQFTVTGASGRGIWGGSGFGTYGNTIDYVNIPTRGNAIDFGDRTYTAYGIGAFSSETRGVFFGGRSGTSPNPNVNSIDYITMASTGNAIDFGDFTLTSTHTQGCSSSTRGFRAGAYNYSNAIEYVEIATTGDGLDFGDLTTGRHTGGSCSSPTRGFVMGGNTPADSREESIDVWTMASKGNAVGFGELTCARGEDPGTASNHIKGIIAGGYDHTNSRLKSIETMLLSTQGVNIDFGNLTEDKQGSASTSNHVSVVQGGGHNGSAKSNVINAIIISSSGDATDFGDLTEARSTMKACSDSHGGLGGF